MADHLQHLPAPEGVVFLGKAQEKTPVLRTEKRRNPETGCREPRSIGESSRRNSPPKNLTQTRQVRSRVQGF
jgi:hypothetical protein